MQNLEVNETIKKTRKTKEEIKKELADSLINIEKNENRDIEEKASKVEKCKDAASVIREFEEVIKSNKSNMI